MILYITLLLYYGGNKLLVNVLLFVTAVYKGTQKSQRQHCIEQSFLVITTYYHVHDILSTQQATRYIVGLEWKVHINEIHLC